MGEFREPRAIIPGAVLLTSFLVTVLLGYGLPPGLKDIEKWSGLLTVAIALLVTSYTGGFLCGTIVVAIGNVTGCFEADLRRLAKALWDKGTNLGEIFLKEYQCEDRVTRHLRRFWSRLRPTNLNRARRDLVAELHWRFHSHAREELIGFATRRLTTVYTSWNCAVALIVGFALGLLASHRMNALSPPTPDPARTLVKGNALLKAGWYREALEFQASLENVPKGSVPSDNSTVDQPQRHRHHRSAKSLRSRRLRWQGAGISFLVVILVCNGWKARNEHWDVLVRFCQNDYARQIGGIRSGPLVP